MAKRRRCFSDAATRVLEVLAAAQWPMSGREIVDAVAATTGVPESYGYFKQLAVTLKSRNQIVYIPGAGYWLADRPQVPPDTRS